MVLSSWQLTLWSGGSVCGLVCLFVFFWLESKGKVIIIYQTRVVNGITFCPPKSIVLEIIMNPEPSKDLARVGTKMLDTLPFSSLLYLQILSFLQTFRWKLYSKNEPWLLWITAWWRTCSAWITSCKSVRTNSCSSKGNSTRLTRRWFFWNQRLVSQKCIIQYLILEQTTYCSAPSLGWSNQELNIRVPMSNTYITTLCMKKSLVSSAVAVKSGAIFIISMIINIGPCSL